MSVTRIVPIKLVRILRYYQIKFGNRIVIGSGGNRFPGWVSTEIATLNVLRRENFLDFWKPNSRLAFLAEHVWEHLPEDEVALANCNCYEFLRPGGWLRLAVPDGYHPDPSYIDAVWPDGSGAGAKDHKVLYNYRILTSMLRDIGFDVRLLEYWDENREFHSVAWDPDDGHVRRSMQFDKRNQEGLLSYTSLIVDAIKPR